MGCPSRPVNRQLNTVLQQLAVAYSSWRPTIGSRGRTREVGASLNLALGNREESYDDPNQNKIAGASELGTSALNLPTAQKVIRGDSELPPGMVIPLSGVTQ